MAVKGSYRTVYEDTDSYSGVSDADILAFVQANINNPAAIAAAAAANNVSLNDLSRATGFSTSDITSYFGNSGVQAPSASQTAAESAALQAANEAAVQQQAAQQAAAAAAAAEAARVAAAAQLAADRAAAEAEARAENARTAAAQAAAQRAAEAAAAAQAAADKAKADAAAQQQAAAAAAKAQADAQAAAAQAQADAQAKAQADAAAKAQADAAAKATTAGIASLPAATKTYTQAEVNQALVDALKNDPNASKADITAAAAGMGISAAQVNAAYSSLPAAPAAVTQPAGIASLPAATTQAAATTAAPMDKAAAVEKITQQILAQGVSSKWKGEGKGSAEANARDMARIIADTGATDINQFGKVTKTVDAAVIPQYEQTVTGYDNEGNQIVDQKIIGYTDQNGNAIDASLVKSEFAQVGSGDNTTYETVYVAPVGKEEVFGNKLTGQEVASTYGERQQGNAFGGTFEG
jgi:SWI/SNF-related matrix-associated actin-dependent regulator 1 of chromatin subfamily A